MSVKTKVISFRVTHKQEAALNKAVKTSRPVGIASGRQLARKICVDFLCERLAYKNPQDALVDLDKYPANPAAK